MSSTELGDFKISTFKTFRNFKLYKVLTIFLD